jgi:hypothetical protein
MMSLGAPINFVCGPIDGIAHGFGMGGNSGAPSLGLPPQSAGLLNSFALQSADMERYLNASQFGGTEKSIDMLRSLTGGGMASIGSLGGLSIGFSDGLCSALASRDGSAAATHLLQLQVKPVKQIGMQCSETQYPIPKQ